MNIDAFKDPSFLAQDDATKQRVLANFFASSTANDSEFASLDPARKERIKNNFISTSLGALTQSSQPQRPKPQSAWRVDPKEGEDYAEPKFNVTAVATTPELFKAAPDKVKAKAAAGVADAAIKKKWEDRAPIIGKPLAAANEFLNRAGLAVETTFGSVANTLGDTFSGSLTPSASTISDSAKKVGITDETALKKLDTLSKRAEQNFTDEELIKVKKLSDPSRTSIISSLMGEKSSYTPEVMQRYVDGLDKALGDKYDVGANIGEKGELIPVAKLKGAGDEGWMELKGDGIWQDLKTGVVATLPITAAQIAGGYAAGRAAKPLITAASSIPGVWGKVAGAVGTAAAFGVGAAAATPVGVAAKNVMNDGEFHAGDTMRESGKEMSDSLLFDAALGVGAGVYQGVKPLLPNIADAMGKFGKWSVGRLVDGNSPAIDSTFKKYGVPEGAKTAANTARSEFQTVDGYPPILPLPDFFHDIPIVKNLAEGVEAIKAPWIDGKRTMALDTTLATKSLRAETLKAAEEFPLKSKIYADSVEKMDNSIYDEFKPVLGHNVGESIQKELGGYEKAVQENYGAMRDTWDMLFPEKIDLKKASGLENKIEELRASSIARDQNGANQLEKTISYLDNGSTIGDLVDLRQELNYLLTKKNPHNLDIALREAKANIDATMESIAKSLNPEEPELGANLLKYTEDAISKYREMKRLSEEDPIYQKLAYSSFEPNSLAGALYSSANKINSQEWKAALSKLSPETRGIVENRVLADVLTGSRNDITGVIDWQSVEKKLSTLKDEAFENKEAKQNLATLKKAADQFWLNKELHEVGRNASFRSPSGGIGTDIANRMEFLIISRWFKRAVMFLPLDVGRAMSFRYQIGEAFKAERNPLKVIAQLQSNKNMPNEAKKDIGKWVDDIISSIPEAKQRTIEAIRADVAAGMDKKLAVNKAMKDYREWEETANLAALKKEADGNNRSGAFNHMVQKDMAPEKIAEILRLPYRPQIWTGDEKGIITTPEYPKDMTKIQEGLDSNYGEKINPSGKSGAERADEAAMAPKREEPSAPPPEARPEPTPALDKWSQQKKDSLYAIDDAEAIARVEPELKEIVEKLKAGTATEEEAAKYIEVMDGYALEINKLRKEAAAAKKAEEVTPAQQAEPQPIDREQAANALEMMAAEGQGFKETRNRYNTQDTLIQKLRSGEELTAKEAETLRTLQDSGAIAHYGEMYKDRAPKNTAFFDKLNAEEMTAREVDEAFGREEPQKVFRVEDYVKAAPKEEVEAEAKEIQAVLGKKLYTDEELNEAKAKMFDNYADNLLTEHLHNLGYFEGDIGFVTMKERLMSAVYAKQREILKRTGREITQQDVNDTTALLQKAVDMGINAPKSKEEEAINAFIRWAGQLLAYREKNPSVLLFSHGGSGLLGGMANGLEYDENGNITGVDEQKFLIGFLGGSLGMAVISSKAGKTALKAAYDKLLPVREAAREGNGLAAALDKKWTETFFAPIAKMAKEGEEEMMRMAGGGTPPAMSYDVAPPFPNGFYSKLESVAEEKLPNKFGVTAANAIFKKNGVKDEELERVDVAGVLDYLKDEKGNVKKADFLEMARAFRERFEEEKAFKHDTFTVERGSNEDPNYRAILVTTPNSDYKHPHWDNYGVVMHIRAQDFVDDKGKMLFIEEIQSDFHQNAKKTGYIKDNKPYPAEVIDEQKQRIESAKKELETLDNELKQKARYFDKYGGFDGFLKLKIIDPDANKIIKLNSDATEAQMGLDDEKRALDWMLKENANVKDTVLDAPFKKTWQEYGIKRMIQEAVDGDYNRVAWTTGDMQAKRYADTPGIRKGMEGFYDKILPDFTRGYIKKYGSMVEKTKLPNGDEVWSFEVTPKMREEILAKGQALYSTPHALGTGTLSGTLAASTGDDEQSMAERFAAGFVGGVGAHAAGAKALKMAKEGEEEQHRLADTYTALVEEIEKAFPEAIVKTEYGAKLVEKPYNIIQEEIQKEIQKEKMAKIKEINKNVFALGPRDYDVYFRKLADFRRENWHKESHPLTKNEDGTPKILYHGARADFSKFENNRVDSFGDYGEYPHFFTDNPRVADSYVRAHPDYEDAGGNIMPVHLSMEDPLIVDAGNRNWDDIPFAGRLHTTDSLATFAKEQGYDGVIVKNVTDLGGGTKDEWLPSTIFIVPEPTQIKSIHNRGTYDETNPNILYSTPHALGTGTLSGALAASTGDDEQSMAERFAAGFVGGAGAHAVGAKALKMAKEGEEAMMRMAGGGTPPSDAEINSYFKKLADFRLETWHKDSHKITKNQDGTPLVVYHGTRDNFSEFREPEYPNYAWSYFASDPMVSSGYAGNTGKNQYITGGNIMPTYLKTKNPLIVDAKEHSWEEIPFGGRYVSMYELEEFAQKQGYDGLVVKNVFDNPDDSPIREKTTVFAVPNGSQIKSIHNRGTYDETKPNILYSATAATAGATAISTNDKDKK